MKISLKKARSPGTTERADQTLKTRHSYFVGKCYSAPVHGSARWGSGRGRSGRFGTVNQGHGTEAPLVRT